MKLSEMTFKVNFVATFKFIKRFFGHSTKKEITIGPTLKRAIFFSINDYKGNENDLRGCVNDQTNLIKRLNKDYPGFDIRGFINANVTTARFITEVTNAIKVLRPGDLLLIHYSGHGTQVTDKHGDEEDGYDEALYLYDGPVIDDNIKTALLGIPDGATVILMFDSCFSGTVTRGYKANEVKNRYLPLHEEFNGEVKLPKRIRIAKEAMKHLVFSGCREDQTSADAYIDGSYNGAFTFYALKTLRTGMTYQEWSKAIILQLFANKYEQVPTLEGNSKLFDRKVFI